MIVLSRCACALLFVCLFHQLVLFFSSPLTFGFHPPCPPSFFLFHFLISFHRCLSINLLSFWIPPAVRFFLDSLGPLPLFLVSFPLFCSSRVKQERASNAPPCSLVRTTLSVKYSNHGTLAEPGIVPVASIHPAKEHQRSFLSDTLLKRTLRWPRRWQSFRPATFDPSRPCFSTFEWNPPARPTLLFQPVYLQLSAKLRAFARSPSQTRKASS